MTRVAERKVALRVERVLRDREETQLNSPADVVAGFFRDYTLHSDAAVLHTRFLRDLYMSSESGSCFEEALHAAALKSRANQLGHKQMATEADVTYGRALTLLNSALQDPLEAKKDATLAASYVVGLSELISGFAPNGRVFRDSHHRGRLLLLRLRGTEQFETWTGRALFAVLNSMATQKCMTMLEPPNAEVNEWIHLAYANEVAMEAEKLHFRAAQLCAEARSLFDDNVHDARAKEHLRNLVEVVNVLDSDYQHWVDKYFASNKWGYRVDTLPFKSPLSIDKVVYTYRDIWIGNVWLGHFSKRTHLHSVILHCVSLLGPGDPLHDQNGYSRSVIARMVSGLCASIPFMLGEIDSSGRRVTKAKKIALGGYLLVCGLQIGRQAVEEGSETEKLFLHTFEHIDKNMGIRSARLLAASRRKQSWQPIEF